MRFFAFDSFEGLPEPVGLDKQSLDFIEGKFATTIDELKENLRANKVPEEKVHIIKGWFDDTLNEENLRAHQMDKAVLIHVDVDYYESAKTVLEFITPLLQNGTVIVFDDWYNYRGNPELGEQRAFKEWLEEHDEWIAVEYHKSGPWRNSFIVNRRSSGSG
jgi:O-methyltransferase